jgi:hypothetical protein
MQSFYAIYSIIPIALFSITIILNVFLIILGFVNLLVNVILFVFVRKIGQYERDKMLPLSILILHSKEYTEDYNKKLKEIIGDNERQCGGNENNLYNHNNEQEKNN